MRKLQRDLSVWLFDALSTQPHDRDDARGAHQQGAGNGYGLDVRLVLRLHCGLSIQSAAHARLDDQHQGGTVAGGQCSRRIAERVSQLPALRQPARRVAAQTGGLDSRHSTGSEDHGEAQTAGGCVVVRRRLRFVSSARANGDEGVGAGRAAANKMEDVQGATDGSAPTEGST